MEYSAAKVYSINHANIGLSRTNGPNCHLFIMRRLTDELYNQQNEIVLHREIVDNNA